MSIPSAGDQPSALSLRLRWGINDSLAASLLSLTSGFADAIGYMQAGIFAANMTGNTVLMGMSLAHGEWLQALERSVALLAFFVGAFAGRLLKRLAGDRPSVALCAETALILIAAFSVQHHALAISLISAAMGVQATAMPKFEGAAVSTVVITSTMARISEIVADRLGHLVRISPPAKPSGMPGGLLLATWACYGLGAVFAVLATPLVARPLVLAALLVATLSVVIALQKPSRPD